VDARRFQNGRGVPRDAEVTANALLKPEQYFVMQIDCRPTLQYGEWACVIAFHIASVRIDQSIPQNITLPIEIQTDGPCLSLERLRGLSGETRAPLAPMACRGSQWEKLRNDTKGP